MCSVVLLYVYIRSYKNYVNQEITFHDSYQVSFQNGVLALTKPESPSSLRREINGGIGPSLHLLVGKTGSGKTNLLQLIGGKEHLRSERKWNGEDDAYFLLYDLGEGEFFLELCGMELPQFHRKTMGEDPTMPAAIREKARRLNTIQSFRFSLKAPLSPGETSSDFCQIDEYGPHAPKGIRTVRERGLIFNQYDIHSFLQPPCADEKESGMDSSGSWLYRMAHPYHRTALWMVCQFIRDYLSRIEAGELKREVSFVLSSHPFAEDFPLELHPAIKGEYWTYRERERERAHEAVFDPKSKKRRKKKALSNKEKFIHDLWADYALYLRKWIEKIHSFNNAEQAKGDYDEEDLMQEYIDYYAEREYRDGIDATILPDGQSMPIQKRCKWLAEYIDRLDNHDPHGILWQIISDIQDIADFLGKLDNRYFTLDRCTVPVVDMVLPAYRLLFEDLFERMEQYHPDDAGIFTKCLLPYTFTHLSTGEYQYAKVLGGVDEALQLRYSEGGKPEKIILLDEPEAYMHPELARQFFAQLHQITAKYPDDPPVQIIIGTHSPFMLSDVFPDEVTRLNIDPQSGRAIVHQGAGKEYYGANIHTILSDGFFLEYTIGEESREFLQSSFQHLLELTERKERGNEIDGQEDQAFLTMMQKLLPHIGDNLIRQAFLLALKALGPGEEGGNEQ